MGALISVIVPIYNVEKYLIRCIESIRRQTYRNLEIILVDDGSPDKSPVICDEYREKDSRIKVIHKENGGISDARNVGLELSCGEYVCFIDSDDFIVPTFVETLYNMCIKYDCEIAQCDFIITHGSDALGRQKKEKISLFSNTEMLENLYNDMYVRSVVAWDKLYKRELFENIRYPVGLIREDEATTCKLFYAANKIAVTNQMLCFYFENVDSLTRRVYSLRQLDIIDCIEIRMKFYKENGLMEFFEKDCLRYLTQILMSYYKVNKFLTHCEDCKHELMRRYNEVYSIAARSRWKKHTRLLMRVCRYYPLLYSGIYARLKEVLLLVTGQAEKRRQNRR